MNKLLVYICFLVTVTSCGVQDYWISKNNVTVISEEPVHSIYLLGDGGKSQDGSPVLSLLQHHLANNNLPESEETILFLGDNIYHFGLPDRNDKTRAVSEARLNAQLNAVKNHQGLKIMLPGNHDWNMSKKGGLEQVIRQQLYVERYLNDSNAYQPKNGCPGPNVFQLNEHLVLLTVDSEWWLHKFDKPEGDTSDCFSKTKDDFIANIKSLVDLHKDEKVLIAMHHPLFTNGSHGGYFPLQDHLFPLRLLNKSLYIPLPVIGSIYPISRKLGVTRQDLSNKHYKSLKNELLEVTSTHGNVIFAGGHEHSLQLHKHNNVYQIVSGAASKQTDLRKGKTALFVARKKGFSIIDVFKDGRTSVRFVTPSDNKNGDCMYTTHLN